MLYSIIKIKKCVVGGLGLRVQLLIQVVLFFQLLIFRIHIQY